LEAIVNHLFISPSRPKGSPLADDAAVAGMASGGLLQSLNFGKSELLQKQKKKTTKFVPFKLDNSLVYPVLWKSIVDGLKADLKNKTCKASNPNTVLHTSRSFCKTIAYSRKPKVAQDQSSCITTMRSKEAEELVAILLDMKLPDFDVKKVTKVVDNLDWQYMNHNFSF
jgi:hypothetical protein